MSNGGWIPVVHQRRGGRSRGYEARSGLYTVFVDNIPRSVDATSLSKLFKKFGVVKDVFIPFKRRKATNSKFGFVRFDCHVASDIAIQKANGLLVDDKVLAVKYATYDRSVPSMRRPQASRETVNPNRGTGSNPLTGHKSFAEVLQRGTTMTIKVNEDGHGWLYESAIIRLNSDFYINSIRSALKDNGLAQVMVRQGGGRDVILTFKSKEELQSNIQKIRDMFKDWSQFVLEWKPGVHIKQERYVWLKCFGIPLYLWNRNTLNNIGALWGSVLHLEGDVSQPTSFSYSRMKVATTCLELINKTINLECKGKLHPVFVCEDHSANPLECNEFSNIGLGDSNNSSNVALSRAEENVFTDRACKRNDEVDTATNRPGAASLSSINETQRKELSNCNSTEMVGTVVEDSLCSRPIVVGVKDAMMEERPLCQSCDEHPQRCVEQASSPGLLKSLSGSIDVFGPGINLEVNLGGHPNCDHISQGPSHGINEYIVQGPTLLPPEFQGNWPSLYPSLQSGSYPPAASHGLGTKSLHAKGPVRCPDPILNPHQYAKKAGKKKVHMEGFSRFARHYGHKSAATCRHSSKSIIFRPAAAALARSELTEGDTNSHSYLLKEAQATVKLGKDLGINFQGQEDGVVDKLIELELKDKERLIRDGKA